MGSFSFTDDLHVQAINVEKNKMSSSSSKWQNIKDFPFPLSDEITRSASNKKFPFSVRLLSF